MYFRTNGLRKIKINKNGHTNERREGCRNGQIETDERTDKQ